MFKVGDKVKVKEKSISKFSSTVISRMRDGGVVTDVDKLIMFPLVEFANRVEYFMWNEDLELRLIKNQQLLFEFMSEE